MILSNSLCVFQDTLGGNELTLIVIIIQLKISFSNENR